MTPHEPPSSRQERIQGRQSSESHSRRATDLLRTAIVRGSFRPNQRLVERDLANWLQVSRTPVREALQILAADGLIDSSPHGWVVHEHTESEIREIADVRVALEGFAARVAAESLSSTDRSELEKHVEPLEASLKLPGEGLVATNERFHNALIQAAHSRLLSELALRSRLYYFNYRIAAMYSSEDIKHSRRQHREILCAVLDGDGEAAEQLTREHIRTGLEFVLRHI